MAKLSLALSILIIFGTCFGDENTETWTDPENGALIIKSKLPPTLEIENVRHQSAGFIEGLFQEGLFYPETAGKIETMGLSGVFTEGTATIEGDKMQFFAFILFAMEHSYSVVILNESKINYESMETKLELSGTSMPEATDLIKEISENLKNGIPKLQKIIKSK